MKRIVLLIAALAAAPPALSSSSETVSGDGVELRLVSAGAPGPDGRLDAVLEIALEPGWKTYWIDPGEAGVPPSLTLAATGVAIPMRLPHPASIDEGGVQLVGYDAPTRFIASLPAGGGPVDTEVFIGICEKICVPVSGKLTLDPASDPANARDAAIVEEALLALPGAPGETFGVTAISIRTDGIAVDAAVPTEAKDAALYVASAAGWIAGPIAPAMPAAGRAAFTVPVSRDGDAPFPKDGLVYVLVADGRAVEGRLTQP
ncbi:MAG: hypothetical protein IPL47_16875 [Phyllobacteriaceae bacterium]|nr:hypothetical protein [Phyllobacteriaceae bacterium]